MGRGRPAQSRRGGPRSPGPRGHRGSGPARTLLQGSPGRVAGVAVVSGTVPGADVAGAIRARALRGTVAEGDSLRGSGHVTARRAARESREPRHVTGAFTAGELAVGQARSWGPRTRTPRGPRSGPRPAPPPLGGESGLGLPEPRFPHLRAADQEAERTEVRRGAGSGGPGVTASPAGVAAAPRWATASEFKSSVLPRGWPETAFFSHRKRSRRGGRERGGNHCLQKVLLDLTPTASCHRPGWGCAPRPPGNLGSGPRLSAREGPRSLPLPRHLSGAVGHREGPPARL